MRLIAKFLIALLAERMCERIRPTVWYGVMTISGGNIHESPLSARRPWQSRDSVKEWEFIPGGRGPVGPGWIQRGMKKRLENA